MRVVGVADIEVSRVKYVKRDYPVESLDVGSGFVVSHEQEPVASRLRNWARDAGPRYGKRLSVKKLADGSGYFVFRVE